MKPTRLPLIAGLSLIAILIPCELNAADSESLLEEVYVTGSHLSRLNPRSIIPMATIDESDISLSTNSLLADTLNRLPSAGSPLSSQTTTNFGLYAPGLSSIDLRNLSPNRTLVLVNGRRYVGGDNERPNVVDLNSIPTALIDRVEVITGGSSAVYGSEAIAGVVNIILKDDFEGIQVDAQWGQSSRGDGQERSISLTSGANFGSAHISFHAGYSDLEEINSRDRGFSNSDQRFEGGLLNTQAYSEYTNDGTITADGLNYFTVGDDGQWTREFNQAEDGLNRADFRLLQVPLDRVDLALNIDYDISDRLSVFLETNYSETKSFSKLAPTAAGLAFLDFGHFFFSDHPFMPPELLSTMIDFYGGDPGFYAFSRRLPELGARTAKQERDTRRIAFGVNGETGESGDWNFDVHYQWGESSRKQHSYGNYNILSFANGLDIEADPDNNGEYRCFDAQARAEGCVPIDIFGAGSIGQDVVDYISVASFDSSRITQEGFAVSFDGKFVDALPAGDILMAFGYEWREEEMQTSVDAFTQTGFSSSNAISSAIKGEYYVNEAYVELEFPLLADMFLVKDLSLNTAYRSASYSTLGIHGSWQFGFNYSLNDMFRFRTVTSESVRAPNIAELFDPGVQTFIPILDPCTNGGLGGPGDTEANCAGLGLVEGYDPGFAGSQAPGLFSGNEDLQEETAKTKTLGVVFTPTEGLIVSLDYFDIRIDDAIEQVDPQLKLSQCYAASNFPTSSFCSGIERTSGEGNFVISRLDFNVQNIGVLETKGWDLDLSYGTEVLAGELDFRALVTRTNLWQSEVNNFKVSKLGEPGFQKWKANSQLTYQQGSVALTWASRYLGHGSIDNSAGFEDWPDDLPSVWYHDLNLRYVSEGDTRYAFYIGANNVTDKEPPFIPSPSANNIAGTNTAAGVYDIAGRFIYLGAEVAF